MSGSVLCLLNGELLPLAEARISPLDRGFLFGDAVYEAVKVLSGKALFLEAHLERLERSLEALRIPTPHEVGGALARLLDASSISEGALYLQISRGAAATRSHLPPPGLAPTLFAFATPLELPREPWTLPGLAAISRRDLRWGRCDVKTTALAAGVLGKLEAADRGAVESLFVGPLGELREGGNTNLFVRDDAGWHTHPLGHEILAGVTRGLLIDAAPSFGATVQERAPRLDLRASWREAFLCGTLTGVRGLVVLDGELVGDGEVGPETKLFARSLFEAEQAAAQAMK